ncbi:MAG: phosphatidylglycerol lysyltransferase domain-containing protein [Candidatus Caenarcaniphilales bacterium]|jgi:phosphatidylglycerol lysyltransferase|nr:phosphatidylglycerol lysyltransferase domain-containing protein [Candidatus Caenarcaniphilales bacterium]
METRVKKNIWAQNLRLFFNLKNNNNTYEELRINNPKQKADEILNLHGNCALDYFKTFFDKDYYFSASKESFLSYKKSNGFKVVLGDPCGPYSELEDTIKNFESFSRERAEGFCLFQVGSKYLEEYKSLGFKKIKIGDEAIVDVANFDLEGAKKKDFRNRIRKLEKLGFKSSVYTAPHAQDLITKLKTVSDEWLNEPRRRERGFSLGYFREDYLQASNIMTIENQANEIVAFLNIIPSYCDGQLGIDLMRKSKLAPSGVMDYLFVKFILHAKESKYQTVNIGLAPMSGFEIHEKAAFEEKAIYEIFKRMNFLFNYEGLKVFKDKFATSWEPKYLIYKNSLQLPAIAIAIKNVLEEL